MDFKEYQRRVKDVESFSESLAEARINIPRNISQERADLISPPIKKGELDVKDIIGSQDALEIALKERFGDKIPQSSFNPDDRFSIPEWNKRPNFKDVAAALKPYFKIETLRRAYGMVFEKHKFYESLKNESLVGDAGTGKTTKMIVSILIRVTNGHGLYLGKKMLFRSFDGKKPVLLLRWYDGMTDPIFWQEDVYNKGLANFYKAQMFDTIYIDDFMQNIGDERTKAKFISLDSFRYLIDFVFAQHDMGAKFFITANATSKDGYVGLFDIFSNSFFERVGTTKPVIDMFNIPSYREV